MTNEFLDESSQEAFNELRTQLENIRYQRLDTTVEWTISQARPLKTILSIGEYEVNPKGYAVYGTLSSVWEVRRIKPTKKKDPAKQFQLTGKASTVVKIFRSGTEDRPEAEIAMWRMEIGDETSPGCHFHVQVSGPEETVPFPKSLPVPRLPSVVATPPAALEFLIGELFQDRWRKHVNAETYATQRWRSIQRDRLTKLLEWQKGQVDVKDGSPWSALKVAKPGPELFVLV
jgi:hypothetical protein